MNIEPSIWYPAREAGLERLNGFLSVAGKVYAKQRNYDHGSGQHHSVSCLSPWIRHRAVGEWEVVQRVLTMHSLVHAEKFIQEVCWRTYWKGWLEMRPQVWDDYLAEVQSYYQHAESMQAVDEATSGNTGIECFDYWCSELIDTGYLHNHARMWFASIWIFTLRLPWQLGADFFMRHLLDGDPAANTLSWRWVAGLHTKGKTYLARSDNIASYTNNRFNEHGRLAMTAEPLLDNTDYIRQPLPAAEDEVPAGRNGLLITDDDLHPQRLPGKKPYASVAGVTSIKMSSPGAIAPLVVDFNNALVKEHLHTHNTEELLFYQNSHEQQTQATVESLVQWAVTQNLDTIVCAYAPVGPNAALLRRLNRALKPESINLHIVRREWDSRFWPHAGKGFFALKKKIPELLQPVIDDISGQQTLF